MTILQIAILAIIQGLAELLPVSSSAHVIAVAKLMRLDPSSPQFTLLLVMLHTGTMFAVILYFWKAWQRAFFSSRDQTMQFIRVILIATVVTGALGFGLKIVIEKAIAHQHNGIGKAEIEELFNHLEIIAASLAAAAGPTCAASELLSAIRLGVERMFVLRLCHRSTHACLKSGS